MNDPSWTIQKKRKNKRKSKAKVPKPLDSSPFVCNNSFGTLSVISENLPDNVIVTSSGSWLEKKRYSKKKTNSKNKKGKNQKHVTVPSLRDECLIEVTKQSNCSKLAGNTVSENTRASLLADKVCLGTEGDINCLLIGDSLLRYAGNRCKQGGCFVSVHPGAKIKDIKHKVKSFTKLNPKVIYFHVGKNNLPVGYRGGPGYNGGCGKREALHSMADLLYTTRTLFPHSKVLVNGVLSRADISNAAIASFNDQLELMCGNFGATFVDAGRWVHRYHLARDGRHLNRGGVSVFGVNLLETCRRHGSREIATETPSTITSPGVGGPILTPGGESRDFEGNVNELRSKNVSVRMSQSSG